MRTVILTSIFYIFAAEGLNLNGSNQSPTLQNETSKIKGNIINKWQQHEDLSSNNPILGECLLPNYTHNVGEVKNLAISCDFWWKGHSNLQSFTYLNK